MPWSSEGRAESRTVRKREEAGSGEMEKDAGLVGEGHKKPGAASPTRYQHTCLPAGANALPPGAQSPPALPTLPPSHGHSLFSPTLGLVGLQPEPALLLLGRPESLDIEHHLGVGQRRYGSGDILGLGSSGLFLANYCSFKRGYLPRVPERQWLALGSPGPPGDGRTGWPGGRPGGCGLKGQGAHFAQEVIAADKVPVPGLHTQRLRRPLFQLEFKRLIPAWVA